MGTTLTRMGRSGPDQLVVRAVTAAETRALRQEVLRPRRPAADSIYPHDEDASTLHLGAYLDGGVVGIASLYREDRPGGDRKLAGWRLRGMASAPDARGRGVGRALLQACVDHVAASGGGELWCNARTPASGFYARAGFEVVSQPFDIPGIGPHVVMRRTVPPSS
jgi:GNAT superfamily N-acetyltransferase